MAGLDSETKSNSRTPGIRSTKPILKKLSGIPLHGTVGCAKQDMGFRIEKGFLRGWGLFYLPICSNTHRFLHL